MRLLMIIIKAMKVMMKIEKILIEIFLRTNEKAIPFVHNFLIQLLYSARTGSFFIFFNVKFTMIAVHGFY